MRLPHERLVPLIVATAFFVENVDATVLSTSLPTIAVDFGENPIHLKLALTSYLLALAVFIPASGWIADRIGARLVFCVAMIVFAAGSIGCGLSVDMVTLVAARVLQGMGGALMIPVGRLLVLRSVDRRDYVNALAWLTIPSLLGPILGPPLGGFITTYFDWRWIFWINVPIAVMGTILARLYIPDVKGEDPGSFDILGFLLVGPGLAATLTGATLAGLGLVSTTTVGILVGGGLVLLLLYVRHSLRRAVPLIDLTLLALPTFRASVVGGFLFRVGIGATPFLLPLLLQAGFGLDPFHSGLTTFAGGVGAIAMKFAAGPILRRFGFRPVLIVNGVISSLSMAIPAFFSVGTPALVMISVLLVGGFMRSLQFTAINAVAYADVPRERLSSASTFATVLQELSGSVGVSLAAMGLEAVAAVQGGAVLDVSHFPPVFLAVGVLALTSVLVFWRLLPTDAGAGLVAGPARTEKVSAS